MGLVRVSVRFDSSEATHFSSQIEFITGFFILSSGAGAVAAFTELVAYSNGEFPAGGGGSSHREQQSA